MKIKLAVFLFVALIVFQPFLILQYSAQAQTANLGKPDLYVGVDVAHEDLAATKQLVDTISSYANLLIIGCSGITYNETRLNDIVQYVVERNMSFIVYTDNWRRISQQWIENAKIQYEDRFLGLYVSDELGGRQLDQDFNFTTVSSAVDFGDAKMQFVNHVNYYLNFFQNQTNPTAFFTSDYAAYHFDYEAGYSTVFAEFGWNYSRELNIGLCRGAATVQNKDWGAMLTWTYTEPPYIESGPELYNDMVLAYQNGAKYIVIFDSNKNYTQSILKQEHFDAMQQFWQYAQSTPRSKNSISTRTAYVLPDDYAYGFRGPEVDDKIWGLWNADSTTMDISMSIASLLGMNGTNLDIIYPETLQPVGSLGYDIIVYWNDARLIPPDWPSFPTVPTMPPKPTYSPTPTTTPTPEPPDPPSSTSPPPQSPTPLPPTATPPTQTTSPDPPNSSFFATSDVYWLVAVIVAGAVGLLVGSKSNKKKNENSRRSKIN
jgi:hypothetical protein